MSIATELANLNQDIVNARAKITSKGGTVTQDGGSSQLATDIDTIPQGVQDISTEAEMNALISTANVGKVYHYTGTTTSKYVNGRYYKLDYGTATREAVDGYQYTFEDSSIVIQGLDTTRYVGLSQSNNYHVNNSYAVCKLVISGVKNFTLWINSYAESSYDYTMASVIDSAVVPTFSSQSTYIKAHTSGFQKNPRTALNETYWRKCEYTEADGLDGGTHYIYIVYRKDNSTSSNDDRGYFIHEKVPTFIELLTPSGTKNITDTTLTDVTEYRKAQIVSDTLIPSNIKKDVDILGVVGTYGGGGGGGFNVYVTQTISSYDNIVCTLNENDSFDIGSSAGTNITQWHSLNDITSIKFSNAGHWGTPSDSYARYRTHGTTDAWTYLAKNTVFALTADIDLEIRSGTCLAKGTLITLADGTKKPVEDIVVGDYVLGYDGKSQYVHQSEHGNKAFAGYRDIWKFENGYKLTTTNRHQFYNIENQKMMYLQDWKIGEHAYTETHEKVALLEHIVDETPCLYFSLWCEGQNYFADGLLAGNRFTPQIILDK